MLIQNIDNPIPAIQTGSDIAERLHSVSRPIAVAPPKADGTPELSVPQLQSAVEKFNGVMRQSKQNLEFSLDTETKKPIIKLVDSVTGELIRQIPSEEMLAIARSIDQFQQGMLLSHKA